MTPGPSEGAVETVSFVIDGRPVEATKGELLIAAAERAGVYIPRFCYHPRLRQVGMCRMCLVEVSGPRGFSLQPACYQPVAEGMEVRTTTEAVRKAQDGVLEFLLVNHPLDCPVCDKGGECPLQDQALTYGPGESRFVEEKRHWAKPIAISALVELDRERCIQCDRCTRFAREVAGEPLITFFGRGDHTEIATFPDQPFASYFSGNTVQICPVGALTASAYRFKARPWDLEQVETTCTACGFGCRMALQSSAGMVVRALGVDVEDTNQSWLCDKGRFGVVAIEHPARRTRPLVADADGELSPTSWADALEQAGRLLREAQSEGGPEAVAVLGGGHLANEDAYAWARLAKSVIGTDSVDADLGDGLPADLVVGLPSVTLAEALRSRVVLSIGFDPREDLPLAFLRLRQAVEGGLPLVEVAPRATSLTGLARQSLRHRPGEAVEAVAQLLGGAGPGERPASRDLPDAQGLAAARQLLQPESDGDGISVLIGRSDLSQSVAEIRRVVALVRRALPGARFLPGVRRGNLRGAYDAGLAPGLLPGRVSLEAGRARFEAAWGRLPAEPGRSALEALRAAADGEVRLLLLIGADPLSDCPDRELADRALKRATVISVETLPTPSSAHARIVLPAAAWGERGGTTTSFEGRVTTLGQKVVAPGLAWPDWMIAAELATELGGDLGVTTFAELEEAYWRESPIHAGLAATAKWAEAGRDGVLLPLTVAEAPTPATARVRALDPMAVPGIGSVVSQGSEPFAGRVAADREEATPPLPMVDALFAFDAEGVLSAEWPPSPPVDQYSLRAMARRRLYDDGALCRYARPLARLSGPEVVRVQPSEADRLGVADGTTVRVRSAQASVELPLVRDEGVPEGSALVDLVADGRAGVLFSAGARVTEVRLETCA
jgi:NADH-quinone oxidoreductase subunit G